VNPLELLAEVIKEQVPEDIWQGSPVIGYRLLGNTNRGEIGEEFIRRFLLAEGIDAQKGGRTAKTDLLIAANHKLEVKTASMGTNRTFQFNHVRLDRQYAYLLCFGICPHELVFNMWKKGELAEGQAGTMVRMAEGQAVTYKLTKKLSAMRPIQELPAVLRAILNLPATAILESQDT
jgi:hypothetical protein